MAKTDGFKTGDLVVLKSGGPVMTVVGLNEFRGKLLIDTAWFGGKKKESGRFPVEALERAKPPVKP